MLHVQWALIFLDHGTVSVENRARPPARYRVKNDVGGQIRDPARPAGWVTFHNEIMPLLPGKKFLLYG